MRLQTLKNERTNSEHCAHNSKGGDMTYSHRNGETAPPTVPGWFGAEESETGWQWVIEVRSVKGELCRTDIEPPRPVGTWAGFRWWGPWEPWNKAAIS